MPSKLDKMEINDSVTKFVSTLSTPEAESGLIAEQMQNAIVDIANKTILEMQSMNETEIASIESYYANKLTPEQTKFMNSVKDNMKFDGMEEYMGVTIITEAVENLKLENELIGALNVIPSELFVVYKQTDGEVVAAEWGAICMPYKEIMLPAFKETGLEVSAIKGFIPVCPEIWKFRPAMLLQYIIDVIKKAFNMAINQRVIDGNGKNQPIGLLNSVQNSINGIHQPKTPITINSFALIDIATPILLPLSQLKNKRVGALDLVMNAVTYYTKYIPKTLYQNINGVTVELGESMYRVILNEYVPDNIVIAGDLKDYHLFLSESLSIQQETNIRRFEAEGMNFLDDMELFYGRWLGTGVPKSDEHFFVIDVTNINPIPAFKVNNVGN